MIVDGFGSSETGVVGNKMHAAGDTSTAPRFTVNAQTHGARRRRHARSSPAAARSAGWRARATCRSATTRTRRRPQATFLEVDGERWVLPGDNATVDEDGTVVLLGRGSTSHQHRRREGLSPKRSRPR